ncbi:MAG: hypothetical protein IPH61_15275 [Bacteroidetes bacterium]|nr:hypothetical protein [Bacteroidota bacterium]
MLSRLPQGNTFIPTHCQNTILSLQRTCIIFRAGDFIYFRYGLKRTSTHELGLANDTSVLPMVMKDYWLVFVLTFIIILLVEWLYRKTEFIARNKSRSPLQIHYPAQIILMTLVVIFQW